MGNDHFCEDLSSQLELKAFNTFHEFSVPPRTDLKMQYYNEN